MGEVSAKLNSTTAADAGEAVDALRLEVRVLRAKLSELEENSRQLAKRKQRRIEVLTAELEALRSADTPT